MNLIATSVGRSGDNSRAEDVCLVQQLLNKKIGATIGLLKVDGRVGPKTIAAIEYFQKFIMGMAHADGRVDTGGRTILALSTTVRPPPANNIKAPPPTNETGAFTSAQQQSALKEAAKFYDAALGAGNMCARFTYNLAHDYVRALRGKAMHHTTSKGALLPAGGNANQQGYHDKLKFLGYSESLICDDCSKENVIKTISGTQFNIGDVIVYWSLEDDSSTRDGHWQYGHTQLFTNKIVLPSYNWASDPKDNYKTEFVYRNSLKYPSDRWALKLFRAPKG